MHRYARPLSLAEVPSLDEAINMVRRTLEANPYRKGRPTDERLLERFVRKNLVDVEAWPFSALVD